MKHEDKELKKEFQIERLILFSDAVFAIAITLLIIEIKIPELHHPFTDLHMLQVLGEESLAKFIGFIVGFLVIALYWINHHRLFGYLSNFNRKLIWGNILFLLTIVIMPFSSGLYSEYWYSGLKTPIGFYAVNILLSGLLIVRLWSIVTKPSNKLADHPPHPSLTNYYKTRSLGAPLIFLLSFLVSYFSMFLSYLMPVFIPLFMLVVKRYYSKKYPQVFVKGTDY